MIPGNDLEYGEWDFKAGENLKYASFMEKVGLGLVFSTVPLMAMFWVPQYYLNGTARTLSAHLKTSIGKYVNRHVNLEQLRIILPPKPLRQELNSAILAPRGKKYNDYNKMFEVKGASARWIYQVPDRTPSDPVVLYLHGGAYFLSTTPVQVFWCLSFINRMKDLRVSVLAVDYTVSPQGRYPVQIQEALAVYTELQKSCDKIISLGDSAGGHLAITLHDHLCEQNIAKPFATVLVSPWAELVPRKTGSFVDNKKYDYIEPDDLVSLYFCTKEQLEDPRANPCRGSAEYWRDKFDNNTICVWGGHEILADVCREFAEKAAIKHTFEQPGGLHDALILNPKSTTSDYIVQTLWQMLAPGRAAPVIPVKSVL